VYRLARRILLERPPPRALGPDPAARPSLRALAAAALALPGIAPSRGDAAEGDEWSFQYTRYQEGERDLFGVHSAYDPIQVDNLHVFGRVTLFDRLKLALHYVQDTWSGATPITTAPQVLGGNRPTAPDGVSGATPYIEGNLYLNSALQPLEVRSGDALGVNKQLVHTLSSASPETRNQLDLKLGHAWQDFEVEVGGGFSLERDYESRSASLSGSWELDQARTTLSLDLQYANGHTTALLDHDATPYIDTSAYKHAIEVFPSTGNRKLTDDRNDWSAQLGVTRILGKGSLLELRLGFARSTGYLGNPYKVMEIGFIDPEQQFLAPPGGYYAQVHALLEQRPGVRNQWSLDTRFVQYVERADAALHLSYRFFHDDWGISAHTLEASWGQPLGFGITITPRIRFYSQSAANFYEPYLISDQAYVTVVSDPDTGDIISITPYDRSLLPSHFSSDYRLSGFGTLSGGLTLSKQLGRGILLEGSFEYYAHKGRLELGGSGEGDYADFESYLVSAALKLDASALHALAFGMPGEPAGHAAHAAPVPAGVMLGHMLDEGSLMVGLRSDWSREDGDILHGSNHAGDAEIARACSPIPCTAAPRQMDMLMWMVEVMGAPSDWLNLMVMPTFASTTMQLRELEGAVPDEHASHEHSTGGVGDLGVYALVRLFDAPGHHLHAGIGLGMPVGDVGLKERRTHQESRGYTHYDMQLGSGTWDVLPSLTYTGGWKRWSWGAQISGVVRLETENDSGYALGDLLQATAWGGFDLTHWLSASVRALGSWQGSISGQYDRLHESSAPMDFPQNYGGRFWDLGFGLAARVPSGYLAGNRLKVEWLQPVVQDVNGYQLERTGTLTAVWSVEF
jgi:hypothetical protein